MHVVDLFNHVVTNVEAKIDATGHTVSSSDERPGSLCMFFSGQRSAIVCLNYLVRSTVQTI